MAKRSAERPNTFHQEICALVPGRLYSLKMVTAHHGDLVRQQQSRKLHAVSIRVDNVEIMPGEKAALQAIFPNHYARPFKAFKGGHSFYMNYHWRLFGPSRPRPDYPLVIGKMTPRPGDLSAKS